MLCRVCQIASPSSAMAWGYNNDAELGAAVRNWLDEHEQEFARPRGRASRYAPY